MFDYQEWLKTQGNPALNQIGNQPVAPKVQAAQQEYEQDNQLDPALAAMLGIEALSPQQEALKRKQAVIDELRGFALGDDPTPHWTGALAKGIGGFASGYKQRKLEPEYEKVGKERREKMEGFGREFSRRRSY